MSENQLHTHFYTIGVSYKKADAQTRGKYSLSKENQQQLLLDGINKGFKGFFVLSTCNRTEIFGFAEHPYQLIQLLCSYSNGTIEEFAKISNIYKGNEAVNQLFRIGTGLESQILGDYEIVGQMKLAFKQAKKIGATNSYLERLMNLVLQASKKVKNQTKISSGTTSVSYAAVKYITDTISYFDKKNILVFGLGKMGKNTCKNLAKYTQNNQVTLINRTDEKSVSFVKEYPSIKNVPFKNLKNEVAKTDILIVSTGANSPTITKEHVSNNKKILILDLSMPENVDIEVVNNEKVKLINVDELSKITDETLAIRTAEVPIVEAIILEHKKEFQNWLHHRKLTPAINSIKKSLEEIQKKEINFHKKKIKNFDEQQAQIITNRFIQKITTQFVKHLKEENTSVEESIEVMTKVFNKA